MKQGWEIKEFVNVCTLIGGSQPSKDDFIYEPKDGYIRLIQVRDYKTDRYATYIPKEKAKRFCTSEDIMIGRYGPPIFGIFKGLEGAYNVALMKAVVNEKICTKDYFYLFLQTENIRQFVEHSSKRAAGQDGVRKELLDKYPVPLPPLPEQQHIVAILDEAFAAIAKAKANAEQNLKNAKALFESYLQGVFEHAASYSQMITIGEICKLTRGHNPPKSKFIYEPKNGYVRFYQIRDGGSDDYVVYVPDTPQLHKVEEDELLMVAYRHIGRVFRGVSGAFNVALCKITNKDRSKLDDDYLFNIIPTNYVRGELLKRSERSLIPSMSVEHLKEISIPLPPLKTQQSIVRQLDALRAETQKLEAVYQQKIADLEELKKSILQKAFAGEL